MVLFCPFQIHFWDFQVKGPPWGYFPEPTKSILVVPPLNVAMEEELFRGMGMTVVTGSLYLGGFISNREAKETWLANKVHGWDKSEKTLSGVARKYPQSAYKGLQKSLQQEWAFV